MPDSLNDYSQVPVPENQTVSSTHIALVNIGGIIAIPCFIVSANIGNTLGFFDASLAFLSGAVILAIMMVCTSWVASVTRLSMSKLSANAFGTKGANLINGLIAFTLIGWYGVNCKMFGDAANTVMQTYDIHLPIALYTILGSALMMLVSLKGFKGIDKLALWLVPLMFVFICYAVYITINSENVQQLWQVNNNISITTSISAVVGTYIVGVVVQPDYCRFAKKPKNTAITAGLVLAIVYPSILILTSIPAIISKQSDLILIMISIGIGIPAFLLLLLSSWSTNVLSLYSSGLSVSSIFQKISLNKITLLIGGLGTLIAFSNVQTYFIDFLVFLGVLIPPVGAIYCLHYYFNDKGKYVINSNIKYQWQALFSWFIGCLFGFIAHYQIFSFFQIASLDSIFTSSVIYFFLLKNKNLN